MTSTDVQPSLQSLGEDLQIWRKLRGLTQQQLAERSGVNRATVARLEHGGGGVSTENLMRVMTALGLTGRLAIAVDPRRSIALRMQEGLKLPQRVRANATPQH
jgi:transcriptional regulator with XRE-family HTH domain